MGGGDNVDYADGHFRDGKEFLQECAKLVDELPKDGRVWTSILKERTIAVLIDRVARLEMRSRKHIEAKLCERVAELEKMLELNKLGNLEYESKCLHERLDLIEKRLRALATGKLD